MEDEGSSLHTSNDEDMEAMSNWKWPGMMMMMAIQVETINKKERKKNQPRIRFIWWKTVQNEIYSVLAFSATSESNPSNKKQE